MDTQLRNRSEVSSSNEVMVSAAITTYNSEAWVSRAIDSVLEQQVEFPIEIVVSDDCSKDNTVAIVKGYQEKYPDVIRLVARPSNVGTQRNYYELFENCRGKYIAWLDADDYWTDPAKLTLQVDALERDPTLMVCGHYVRWVFRSQGGKVYRDKYPTVNAGRHGMSSILRSNFLPSPSVMFRNGLHRSLPEWYFDVSPLTDWPLYVVAACHGDILLIDRVMADYTLNETSTLWGKGTLFWHRADAMFYERIESVIPKKFYRSARAEKGKRYEEIAYVLRKKGDFKASREAAIQAFRSPAVLDNLRTKSKSLAASLLRELQWRSGLVKDASKVE